MDSQQMFELIFVAHNLSGWTFVSGRIDLVIWVRLAGSQEAVHQTTNQEFREHSGTDSAAPSRDWRQCGSENKSQISFRGEMPYICLILMTTVEASTNLPHLLPCSSRPWKIILMAFWEPDNSRPPRRPHIRASKCFSTVRSLLMR